MRNFEKMTRKSTRFDEFEGKKGSKRNKIVRCMGDLSYGDH